MSIVSEGLSRRSMIAWSTVAAGGASLVAAGAFPFGGATPANAGGLEDADKTIWSACLVNCGSRCPLRLQIKDGVIARVLADDTGSDELGDQQIRACIRGRSIRHSIYSPHRLKKPLVRRPGTKRGDKVFDEISWDEATSLVTDKITYTNEKFGPDAIHFLYWSGVEGGNFTHSGGFRRLLKKTGGFLDFYGTYSVACMVDAIPAHYGTWGWDNSMNDAANSNLLVLWGDNSLETRMSGGGWTYILQQVRKQNPGLKIIVIDPRYTDTAQNLADQWIPIRPGTDAALVAGMVHHMVESDLHDQEFLDRYCLGFDEDHMPEDVPANSSYLSYIQGLGPDGVEKTPEWASELTGIPAETIRNFAVQMATANPCAIRQGWGIQRQANGETACRAPMLLANVIGSVGKPGGGTGVQAGNHGVPVMSFDSYSENPVEALIPTFLWTDAIDHGKDMTATTDGIRGADKLKNDIKMMVVYASNTLINQHSDTNRTRELLEDESKCEFIVGIDNQMTPSMEYCDLILPETTWSEREDFIAGIRGGDMGFALYMSKSTEPLYETRDGWDMCVDIAKKLGIEEEFTEGLTKEEWVGRIYDDSVAAVAEAGMTPLPSREVMREQGVYRDVRDPMSGITYKDFIDDPEENPLGTPSGKIEIFSQAFYEASKAFELPEGDRIPALPEQVETFEGHEKVTEDSEYPLQCIGHHFKGHVHSSYFKVDWLLEAHRHELQISEKDAKARGISNGDDVFVFNDRGRVRVPAFVTPRIMPGVVSIPQGAWLDATDDGIDEGGNINTLTSWHPSPFSKGTAQHTNLVEVAKA
ncbi:DMSO/selenate family reductase complex A subunit [Flaviflexus huanghaiensis]|uniref:DMSO/selenate family reductase complex A subunit n=1 Tax=Flaviflexus huanghaiensis TaxID=1111473 RepID=UPI0015FCD956|nr:DMSO/selenate family reductase complex A subunit [Flaviflexus huanghaiensis]